MNSFQFPKKLEGSIFTEYIPNVLPEVLPKKLIELGTIVAKKERKSIYGPLTDSLRKLQWVKLVGVKAIKIEKELASQMTPEYLIFSPVDQIAHSLCITDCLIHTKSALDSIAVFLTDLLNLPFEKGNRDLKKHNFRMAIFRKEKSSNLGKMIIKFTPWFNELQKIRDEWIHRSAIRCNLLQGNTEIGVLPIPKKLELDPDEQMKLKISKEKFYSTEKFINYHYSNLVEVFNNVIERAIQIETTNLREKIPIPNIEESKMSIFYIRPVEDMKPKGIKIKNFEDISVW